MAEIQQEPGTPPTKAADDLESLELWISWLLRVGVMLSGLILIIGLGLEWTAGAPDLPPGSGIPFHNAPVPLPPDTSVLQPLMGLTHGQPVSVIQLGLLILILTPMLRVAAALVLFILQRDRVYMVVSMIVLGTLLFSFNWNLHEGGATHRSGVSHTQRP